MAERTINDRMRDAGYWHRPYDAHGKHEVLTFNTNEVVGVYSAGEVLAVLGLQQEQDG